MDHHHDHGHSKSSQSGDRHSTTPTAEEYESRHVHVVYEEIASHFLLYALQGMHVPGSSKTFPLPFVLWLLSVYNVHRAD